MRHLSERPLFSKRVYRGRAVDFLVDTVRLPDGEKASREYLDHPGAVGVVPFVDSRRIVLVRQYRYPVRATTLEIPAGKLDRGEKALDCVRRELQEETGYTGGVVRPLLRYWPTSAFSNEVLHLFVARGIKPGPPRPDSDEFLETTVVDFHKAVRMVRAGRIMDSKTAIALLFLAPTR